MTEEDQAPPPLESSGSTDPEGGFAPEISRRVGSILDAVEREAARLREEAREDAARYLEHAKRRADGLVAERQRRISELSDELMSKSEAVVARLDDAAPVRQGFENLVRALGDAAERLSRETEISSADFEPQPFAETHGVQPAAPAPYPRPPAPETFPPQTAAAPGGPLPDPYAPSQPRAPAPSQPPPGGEHPESTRGFPAQPHPARAPEAPGWQPPTPAQTAPQSGGAPGSSGWREIDDARMVAIQMATTGTTRAGVRDHLNRALGIGDTASILDEIFGVDTGEDARVPWTAGPR